MRLIEITKGVFWLTASTRQEMFELDAFRNHMMCSDDPKKSKTLGITSVTDGAEADEDGHMLPTKIQLETEDAAFTIETIEITAEVAKMIASNLAKVAEEGGDELVISSPKRELQIKIKK